MAISVDLSILWTVTWFSHRFWIVLDRLCVQLSFLVIWPASIYNMVRCGNVEGSGNPHSVPCGGSCVCWCLHIACCFLMTLSLNVMHLFCQSMIGLYCLIHGIPRITSSLPRSATYHLVFDLEVSFDLVSGSPFLVYTIICILESEGLRQSYCR